MVGLLALSSLLSVAEANDWERVPYVMPILNVRAVTVGGVTTAQAVGGAEAGLVQRYADKPHWMSHTRGAATGIYSFTANSIGADVRVGSFFGPDGRWVRWQVGPDVWFNGYGVPGALDYHLPWSPGVDLRNAVTLKVVRGFALLGEATPGWAFVPERALGGLGPFHELTLLGAVRLQTDVLTVTVGYQRAWNAVGTIDGFIISGRL